MILSQRAVLPPVQLAELDTDVYRTGTWPAQLTGYAAGVNLNIRYIIILGVVYLFFDGADTTGTSNSAGLGLSAQTGDAADIPSVLRPTVTRETECQFIDNGVKLGGGLIATTSGEFGSFLWNSTAVANRITRNLTAFTASGAKGLPSRWTASYPL